MARRRGLEYYEEFGNGFIIESCLARIDNAMNSTINRAGVDMITGNRFLGHIRLLAFAFMLSLGLPTLAEAQLFGASRAEEDVRKAEEASKAEEAFNSLRFIAISDSRMTWADAKAYCQQKGGRLPLIGGSSSLSSVPKGAPLDGFGTEGGPIPTGLPGGTYWTGTEGGAGPRYSWFVFEGGGKVGVNSGHQSYGLRVVCVP